MPDNGPGSLRVRTATVSSALSPPRQWGVPASGARLIVLTGEDRDLDQLYHHHSGAASQPAAAPIATGRPSGETPVPRPALRPTFSWGHQMTAAHADGSLATCSLAPGFDAAGALHRHS